MEFRRASRKASQYLTDPSDSFVLLDKTFQLHLLADAEAGSGVRNSSALREHLHTMSQEG
jgi:hypothetical protein